VLQLVLYYHKRVNERDIMHQLLGYNDALEPNYHQLLSIVYNNVYDGQSCANDTSTSDNGYIRGM
jgi:hypothetical protein